ncbi:type II toxin-antitoxin system HicA family toxin [Alicyclobacillus cellulosilyticus]|uniref:type II toxin-antitoxin system HicA family toxin n=1 Tax=Alicyclobacillus cellulosilyticus TaxID=1003997 RepID=UPI001664290F
MPRLPVLAAKDIVHALQRAGFEMKRQSGSHMILEHTVTKRPVVVPKHNPVKRGTLHSIIHQAGLTAEEFMRLL